MSAQMPGTAYAGIFWDIENIPIRKASAVADARDAVRGLQKLTHTNHFQDENLQTDNVIKTFVIVARMANGLRETTPQFCKDQLVANGVQLIDLPPSSARDVCDDEIVRLVQALMNSMRKGEKITVYLSTGDRGLIDRVSSFNAAFDLIVIVRRARQQLQQITGFCRNVRRENGGRGRRLNIYLYEEVIRAGQGTDSDFPVNDVAVFAREGVHDLDPFADSSTRQRNSVNRTQRSDGNNEELDESGHFDSLFPR
ncbi:uncharacterized protein LOC129589737 [Paramacrobiotus metropolitanus]|uniref:uncharacterized protein LOC129589737 n=1 Tax=Paramacrobiotus metropolitanus TaxID=2943436 RepID=UPI0024461C5B|nr:uncharacterized protein LOC129589737 [Paramacrobiotus metropolitanus]